MLFDQGSGSVQQLLAVETSFVHVFYPFHFNYTRLAAEVLRFSHADGVDGVATVAGRFPANPVVALLGSAQKG